jgi:hypothetical protein
MVALRKRQHLGRRVVLDPVLKFTRLVNAIVTNLEDGHHRDPDLERRRRSIRPPARGHSNWITDAASPAYRANLPCDCNLRGEQDLSPEDFRQEDCW